MDFDDDQLQILATKIAIKELPEDELQILLEEEENGRIQYFDQTALHCINLIYSSEPEIIEKLQKVNNAMHSTIQNAISERKNKPWRKCLAYPHLVDDVYIAKLDALADKITMTNDEDRYLRLAAFLKDAKEQGLINDAEYENLRIAVARHI